MTFYRVSWEIDVDADTPEEAAERALEIQRNPASTATVFEVRSHESGAETGITYTIDLDPEEQ